MGDLGPGVGGLGPQNWGGMKREDQGKPKKDSPLKRRPLYSPGDNLKGALFCPKNF